MRIRNTFIFYGFSLVALVLNKGAPDIESDSFLANCSVTDTNEGIKRETNCSAVVLPV